MKHSVLAASLLAVFLSSPALADGKGHEHMKDAEMMKERGHMHAQEAMKDHAHMADGKPMHMAQSSEGMSDGVIKRISKGSKKLTIKHGEIKNLDMPPMTMSFRVSDEKMLEMVKKGDKVKFKAETVDGKMVVTEILPQ